MRLMHFGFDAFVIGEIATPAYSADDLLVVCSGSGETGSLVSIAERRAGSAARSRWSRSFPIQHRQARRPAPDAAGTVAKGEGRRNRPIGPADGLAFEQAVLLFLDAVILELMARRGVMSEEMFTRHANLE
jgi:Predicted sugar phosphate isomerase involved in capsule formation